MSEVWISSRSSKRLARLVLSREGKGKSCCVLERCRQASGRANNLHSQLTCTHASINVQHMIAFPKIILHFCLNIFSQFLLSSFSDGSSLAILGLVVSFVVGDLLDLFLEAVWRIFWPPHVKYFADAAEATGFELQGVLDALGLQSATIPNSLKEGRDDLAHDPPEASAEYRTCPTKARHSPHSADNRDDVRFLAEPAAPSWSSRNGRSRAFRTSAQCVSTRTVTLNSIGDTTRTLSAITRELHTLECCCTNYD